MKEKHKNDDKQGDLPEDTSFLIPSVSAGYLLLLATGSSWNKWVPRDDRINNKGLIGLGVGLVVGLIILVFLLRYGSYTYKAAHIAMMTKGLTERISCRIMLLKRASRPSGDVLPRSHCSLSPQT